MEIILGIGLMVWAIMYWRKLQAYFKPWCFGRSWAEIDADIDRMSFWDKLVFSAKFLFWLAGWCVGIIGMFIGICVLVVKTAKYVDKKLG